MRRLPFVGLLVILGLLVVFPVAMLAYASFVAEPPRPGQVGGPLMLDNYATLATGDTASAVRNSLLIGLGATTGSMVLGSALAWVSARTNAPGKIVFQMAGIAPLFMSSVVTSLAWSILGSPEFGLVNLTMQSMGLPFGVNIYTLGGIIFVLALTYTPYVFLLVTSALNLMNPEFEEAAAIHGANRRGILRYVTMPMITPAVAGAAILTFVLAIENFVVPAVLGVRTGILTLPSLIWQLMSTAPSRPNEAAAVGMLLTTLTVVLVFVQRYFVLRRSFTTVSGKGFRPREIDLGRLRWVATGAGVLFLVAAVLLPYVALIRTTLAGQQFLASFSDIIDFSAWEIGRFFDIAMDEQVLQALRNSLLTAVGAAILGGILHFTMSYYVYRTREVGRSFLEYIAMLPVALPGLVMGMGFLWAWLLLPVALYGTLLILVLAFVVRFMPQGFRGVSSTILQVHPDLEDSAVISGASRVRSVGTITIPLIRSGLVSAMLLIGVLALRELSAALFLFTSNTRTLSIVIWDYWALGRTSNAAGASMLYSIVLVVITIAARRWLTARTE